MFGRELSERIEGGRLWAVLLKGDLEDYLAEQGLAESLGGWLGRMRPFRGTPVVTYHRSWTYFARRFGLAVAGELEPKPGIPPSPSHLREIVDTIRARHIPVILIEPFYPRKAADFVASRTGARVVVCPNSVGGSPEATDYLALLDAAVRSLQAVLQEVPSVDLTSGEMDGARGTP
jgi:ABC-type Zn2+ transport system substrate-binding protein/surface adhesin